MQQDAAARTAPKLASAPRTDSPVSARFDAFSVTVGFVAAVLGINGRLQRESPLCIL